MELKLEEVQSFDYGILSEGFDLALTTSWLSGNSEANTKILV